MNDKVLKVLAFGAHPDDCDFNLGGTAIKYAKLGHKVKFISVTNGDAGHYLMGGAVLAQRRYKEAKRAAEVAGIEYEVFDIHDGQLLPTLENRNIIIRVIREFEPDIIFTHRPNDYHPDHRYTSQLVQDAAYMVTVPNVAALTQHLLLNPVIFYVSDSFQKPYPFSPDIIVGIDDSIEQKIRMLHCHESQMYEWLPYNQGILNEVPKTEEERLNWLQKKWASRNREIANKYREQLVKYYGKERGSKIEYAEAFEKCEYGSSLPEEKVKTYFPFF
ncbi:MAG: PIG-L family deacetylase [Candidatus Bathyarchaeia archaeon]